MNTLQIVSLALVAASAALLFIGVIFGMVAVPTINEKLGILCILIPVLVVPVCLLNYNKTKYASNFIIWGIGLGLLALAASFAA